jgi:glutathione S-transferase
MMAWRIARRYAAWGYGPGALEHFAERMRENLATLSTLLDGKDYLLGRVPTVADVAVFAQLAWMRRYAERDLLDDAPVVRDWLDAFAALPPVAAALAS